MTKRAVQCTLVVETELTDDQLAEELRMAAWKMTKSVEGRMVVTAGVLAPEDAQQIWDAVKLGPKPKPGGKVWSPTKS